MRMSSLLQKRRFPALNQLLGLAVISIFRLGFFCLVIAGLNTVVQPGTSPVLLGTGAALGIIAGTLLTFTRLKTAGFIGLSALLYLCYRLLFTIPGFLPQAMVGNLFATYTLGLHLDLALVSFFVASFSTWCFYRFRYAAGLEALLCTSFAILALSGHRNFHFESPQVLNSLAWYLGIEPLKAIILVGLLFTLGLVSFLLLSGVKIGPGSAPAEIHKGQKRPLAYLMALSLFSLILIGVSQQVYRYFNEQAQTRAANGVGQKAGENMSPLGFHSSIGGSNQPSGLVRLEGDYPGNPYTPMLYLREHALSLFNGHEFVMASAAYDQEASQGRPDEAFQGTEDAELMNRTPLVQSIYLLANHEKAFAADYPLSIKPLKNPNPGRFKGAFKAYSISPSFDLESTKRLAVGDPRWNSEHKELYLKQHPDPRYKKMAEEITAGLTQPVEKAFAITEWLSKHAIYTLKPGHEVKEDEDPVAPFLFGDLRGYCVHFAHAVTYMLRSLGIPSRIATGYLTDLSESKDGHILLRMSDRHAWAEVFVEGRGWLPFDIKPEKVESAADSAVDMKLLEELMGLIGPDEEVLPKEIAADEKALEEEPSFALPDSRYFMFGMAALAALLLCSKLYLLYGWKFRSHPAARVRAFYISMLCRLCDTGLKRGYGETRQEFRKRAEGKYGFALLSSTEPFLAAAYGDKLPAGECITRDMAGWRRQPLYRRVLGAVNPRSVFALIFGVKL